MFKYEYNHAIFHLTYKADGPLLIKSSGLGIDPTLPDMQFIRTYDSTLGEEVPFIPGSSIRGVIRSFVERVLKSYSPRNVKGACDIINKKDNCLDQKDLKNLTIDKIYSKSCLACRMFGNQGIRSRIEFTDAYIKPDSKYTLEIRNGVAISRQLGSAARGALYELEVLTKGSFTGEIHLRNFELWQLGALVLALENFNLGFLKLGFGANRGLGKINVLPTSTLLYTQTISSNMQGKMLSGIKHSYLSEKVKDYDLKDEDQTIKLPETVNVVKTGLGLQMTLTTEEWQTITPALIQSLQRVVQ